MIGQRWPDIPWQLSHHPWQSAHQRPVVLIEHGRILGGEQRRIDSTTSGPLPLGTQFLDLALQLRALGMEQPHQPLLGLAHPAGATQPLQPVEPAGRGRTVIFVGLLFLLISLTIRRAMTAAQLAKRRPFGPLPQQNTQQILTKRHQAMMGLGIEQMGKIPLVQHRHLWALGTVTGQRAEIEPEITPVKLLHRQLQGIEQTDRLTVTIARPLAEQIREQRELASQAALPLLALFAGNDGIGLLQPAKPEQGAERTGPLPGITFITALPLTQRRQQMLIERATLALLGQRLQRRPAGGGILVALQLTITAKPVPLCLTLFGSGLYLGSTAHQGIGQRPALFIRGIEQQLQREVLQQQLLPGGAGACQQLVCIRGIEQGQQIAGGKIGRDLPRLAAT